LRNTVLQAHLFFHSKGIKKIVNLILSAALHIYATLAIDFKTQLQNVGFPSEICWIQAVAGTNLK
jgi:hypothetical protein